MAELFADIPEALANSVEIARRCNVVLELGKPYLPDYPVPQGLTMDEYFRQLSHEGLDQRLQVLFDTTAEDFSGDAATVPGAPGFRVGDHYPDGLPRLLPDRDGLYSLGQAARYSGGTGARLRCRLAGGLRAGNYRPGPTAYDLLFERFLNPERVSMPDFDVDFCMEKRDRVIEYVADTYGREAVSQIITFGTMAAKAVVRDVARVQGKSYGLADKLSKMIPFEVGMTLAKALEQEEPLQRIPAR